MAALHDLFEQSGKPSGDISEAVSPQSQRRGITGKIQDAAPSYNTTKATIMVTITDTIYANDDLEIPTADIDPKSWMPVGNQAWSLPLMFDRNAGSWVSQLRVEGEDFIRSLIR